MVFAIDKSSMARRVVDDKRNVSFTLLSDPETSFIEANYEGKKITLNFNSRTEKIAPGKLNFFWDIKRIIPFGLPLEERKDIIELLEAAGDLLHTGGSSPPPRMNSFAINFNQAYWG